MLINGLNAMRWVLTDVTISCGCKAGTGNEAERLLTVALMMALESLQRVAQTLHSVIETQQEACRAGGVPKGAVATV